MLNTQNAVLKMTAGRADQFPRDGLPQIALSGRSNVGKSSLINTLLGRKSFARTSSSPGKTVTINFYEIDKKLYLVDLPGYGYARRSESERREWAGLTNDYRERHGMCRLSAYRFEGRSDRGRLYDDRMAERERRAVSCRGD